jgi:hypothetical protein
MALQAAAASKIAQHQMRKRGCLTWLRKDRHFCTRSTRLVTLVGHLLVVVCASVLLVVMHGFSGGTVVVPSRGSRAHSKSKEKETDEDEPLHVSAPNGEGGVSL